MKTIIISILAILFISACKPEKEAYIFTSFREPATDGLYLAASYDGYNWEDLGGSYLPPEIGTHKLMRDPSVTQGPDGTFHMVWTTSWNSDLGFGYASTKDFINWSEQRKIDAMAFDTSTVNVWAPEIFYDDEDDRFIIFWASTIPYKFEKGIEDERNNHRMYYTTTKDFETFTDTKLFLDPGFSVIDCVIVKRKKNDYVLVLKDNTRPNRNISVAFGESPLGPFSNYSEPLTGFLTEGPTVAEVNGEYLLYYDSYGDDSYKALKTTDFIEFTDVSNEISLPDGHKHGTIVKVKQSVVDNLMENKISSADSNE